MSAERAAIQGLPTIDSVGNIHFNEPLTPELGGDVAVGQKAMNEAFRRHVLMLTCRKCTKTEMFSGGPKAAAVQAARDAGWVYDIFVGKGIPLSIGCSLGYDSAYGMCSGTLAQHILFFL